MKIKLPRLKLSNQKGFGHIELILALVVVVAVGAAGARILTASHADTLAPDAAATTTTTYTNGNIWSGYFTVKGDGTGFTAYNLPVGAAAQYSNISYDGTKIAYFYNEYPFAKLGVANVNGSNAKTIVTLPSNNYLNPPMWSPNGTWLAMPYSPLTPKSKSGVWLVKSDGTSSHSLPGLSLTYTSNVSWFANSTSLMYMNYSTVTASGSKLCSITMSGTNNVCHAIVVGSVPASGQFFTPVVSPDGTKVLMITYNNKGTLAPAADLYVVNRGGTGLKKLTSYGSGEQIQAVVWSPDQKKIAYILNANDAKGGVHVMNADGTGDALITNQQYPDSLSWAHN